VTPLARLVPLAVALAAAAAVGVPSQAQTLLSAVEVDLSFGAKPALHVTTLSAGGEGVISLSSFGGSGGGGRPLAPAQVTVDLGPGYVAAPTAIGSSAGLATATSISGSASGASLTFITGSLTTDDPTRYANDANAKACAPGPYTAVWRLDATIFGLDFTMPVFVEHPAADSTSVELRFCAPPLTDANGKPVTATPVPLTGVGFLLTGVTGPTARGSYTSSALVTPEDSSGAPAATATVEARSVHPIPHTLKLAGRYDAKARAAVLTGSVTELGKPQSRATVEYVRADTFGEPRRLRTNGQGKFATRVRIAGTATFEAAVPDVTAVCSGPSPAPGGCVSLIVIGSNTRTVRVVVPR
jgi:hypothetical protein